jgi:hypothetical protein
VIDETPPSISVDQVTPGVIVIYQDTPVPTSSLTSLPTASLPILVDKQSAIVQACGGNTAQEVAPDSKYWNTSRFIRVNKPYSIPTLEMKLAGVVSYVNLGTTVIDGNLLSGDYGLSFYMPNGESYGYYFTTDNNGNFPAEIEKVKLVNLSNKELILEQDIAPSISLGKYFVKNFTVVFLNQNAHFYIDDKEVFQYQFLQMPNQVFLSIQRIDNQNDNGQPFVVYWAFSDITVCQTQ